VCRTVNTTTLASISAPLLGLVVFTAIALGFVIFAHGHRRINAYSVPFLLGVLGVTIIVNIEWSEEDRVDRAAHTPPQLGESSPARALYPLPPPQFPQVLPPFVAMARPATGAAAPPAVANPYARRL
jgi:hypothetical protein